MEHSTSSEADRFSANRESPRNVWNRKVHHRVNKCPRPVIYPETDQSSPCPPSHFLKIHRNNILPLTPRSPKWSLSLRFSHQKPVSTSSLLPICVLCPAHLILLDLITQIIFGEEVP